LVKKEQLGVARVKPVAITNCQQHASVYEHKDILSTRTDVCVLLNLLVSTVVPDAVALGSDFLAIHAHLKF